MTLTPAAPATSFKPPSFLMIVAAGSQSMCFLIRISHKDATHKYSNLASDKGKLVCQDIGAMLDDNAEWVRRGLKKQGKSQAGLARALGVAQPQISRMLTLKDKPRRIQASEIPIIAAYLEMAPPAINVFTDSPSSGDVTLSAIPRQAIFCAAKGIGETLGLPLEFATVFLELCDYLSENPNDAANDKIISFEAAKLKRQRVGRV